MTDRASSSITVAASPATVMAVIADFPAYPQWAEFVSVAEVLESGPDERASRVRFVVDAGVFKDEYVLSYRWQDDASVEWNLESGRAQRAQDGCYLLTGLDDGRTEVRYELAVELAIPMLGLFKRRAEKVIMDTALRGLKKRVESSG